jgi:hypothetical protein
VLLREGLKRKAHRPHLSWGRGLAAKARPPEVKGFPNLIKAFLLQGGTPKKITIACTTSAQKNENGSFSLLKFARQTPKRQNNCNKGLVF